MLLCNEFPGTSAWDTMYWERYKYDTAGNMVDRKVYQIVGVDKYEYVDSSFTYSRGYQLTGFTRWANSRTENRTFTLTYDANGNMTHIQQSATFTDTFYNITEMEFQFDEKNRMTQYRFGGSGSYHQIKYDALGRVRERVNLTPTTSKYYSDGRQLIQQLDNSDNVDFDYFRGPTGLMRQLDVDASNKKRFYIKDPLGTVWAMVDPSDLSVEHYNYNAWGEHLDKDDTDFPTDENLMRYIGCRVEAFGDSTAQTDAIYHLDQRFYIPSLASFHQRDHLQLNRPSTKNYRPYGYANNNPPCLSDPTGLITGVRGCFRGDETFSLGQIPGFPPFWDCGCMGPPEITEPGSGYIYLYTNPLYPSNWILTAHTKVWDLIQYWDWINKICDILDEDPGSFSHSYAVTLYPQLCCYLLDQCSPLTCNPAKEAYELGVINVLITNIMYEMNAKTPGYNWFVPHTGPGYMLAIWPNDEAPGNCQYWQHDIYHDLKSVGLSCWLVQGMGMIGVHIDDIGVYAHHYVEVASKINPHQWYAADPWYYGSPLAFHGWKLLKDLGHIHPESVPG